MPIDLRRYRDEFPVSQSSIYMNHAAVAPISRRVLAAMVRLLEDVHHHGLEHGESWLEAYEAARGSAARLLNADAAEIALTKNTSEGISFFANGLDWQPGDEVVSVASEFPANFYPWKFQERKGVRLRLVEETEGRLSLDALSQALTPRTRVVAVSHVQYISGFRLDLEKLGALCADRGCLLFVDAIQGLGAFPIDVRRCRIACLAADGHKWILGPEGAAVMFLNREVLDKVSPSTVGWTSVRGWRDYSSREFVWREGASRFEAGTLNTVGVYGLGAALDLLLEIGVGAVGERVLELTGRLRRGLRDLGHKVFGPLEPCEASGIVSFVPRQGSPADIAAHLRAHRVQLSERGGKVRLSPHIYNTEEEVDRVLGLLS